MPIAHEPTPVRHNPQVPTTIAVVGDRDPSHLTHRELDAALALMPAGVDAPWVATDGPEASRLDRYDALWIVPGTPYRDERPVFAGIECARTEGVPILGTCGGFQHMVVEFARNAAGISEAAHAETAPDAGVHAVSPLACSLEGEVRQVTTVPGTRVAALCGPGPFAGFHWCNYGLSPAVLDRLVAAGLVVSATAPDAGVEAVELPDHPFYVGTLFQPQVGSSETGALHPLIAALVEAAAAVRSA
jgi:CTP synthase (UTP-ammonia lyase)